MEEKAIEEQPFDEIEESTLNRIIEDIAGWNRKTKKNYKRIMQERNIVDINSGLGKVKILTELEEEQDASKEVDFSAPKKNVTITVNRDLVEKADAMNINKSNFFEKKLTQKVANLPEQIEMYCDEPEEDIEFIKDLILEGVYMAGKNDRKRKELYIEHFGNYNDFACEELRKEAVKVAEKLGIEEKPEGL